MSSNQLAVLFVCMGNICRSPAAEAVFLAKTERRRAEHRFEVDSAGTGGWHIGEKADPRSRKAGTQRGYTLQTRCRQVCDSDWAHFDLLIGMDASNREELLRLGAPVEKIKLLTDWHPDASTNNVPDPYYGSDEDFDHMYALIEESVDCLIDFLLNDFTQPLQNQH